MLRRTMGLGVGMMLVGCPSSGGEEPDGSTAEDVDLDALLDEVRAPGPHGVGYRTTSVSWADPLLHEGGRELRVSIWYPTDDRDGDEVSYQNHFEADGVLGDAALAGSDLPVAIFSHGHQAYGEASGFLMEHLASHGWVVLAPDHRGNLIWDGGERDTEIYLQRPLDVSAVLDWLDDPAGDPLDGALADGRLGIGHSFGGYTIQAVAGADYDAAVVAGCDDGTAFCSTMTSELADRLDEGFDDPRLDAVVSMAPGDYRLFGPGVASIDVPVLLMSGGFDESTESNAAPIWEGLSGAEHRWVHLPGLGHNGFTDAAGSLDPEGVMEPEAGWAIVRGAVLAFGRAQLGLHDASGRLLEDGSPMASADVELRQP